jgi:hypothetical protein
MRPCAANGEGSGAFDSPAVGRRSGFGMKRDRCSRAICARTEVDLALRLNPNSANTIIFGLARSGVCSRCFVHRLHEQNYGYVAGGQHLGLID